MDSLGKVFDIFIMIIMFFVIPVNWAMSRTDQAGVYTIDGIIEDYLYKTGACGKIDYNLLDELDYKLGMISGRFSVELSIRRRIWESSSEAGGLEVLDFISEIPFETVMDEIAMNGYFNLMKNDILMVDIYDEDGFMLRKMRLII